MANAIAEHEPVTMIASSPADAAEARAACAGAVSGDVLRRQLGALSSNTAYVSVTVGGNDLDFEGVLTECAMPAWMSDCTEAVDEGLEVLDTELPGRISTLLAAIRRRAPRATVLLTGQPTSSIEEVSVAETGVVQEITIENALQVLRSQRLALRVTEDLGLAEDPRFLQERPSGLAILVVGEAFQWYQAAALTLVLGGIVIAERFGRRERPGGG